MYYLLSHHSCRDGSGECFRSLLVSQPASQPAWGLRAASWRTRGRDLTPGSWFWSPHIHPGTWAIACYYSIGTSWTISYFTGAFHRLPMPFLAFISVCRVASLTLLQLHWLPCHPRIMPHVSAEFLCTVLSSAVVLFSKPICSSHTTLLPNHCSSRVYPECLLTVMPRTFYGPRLMAPGLLHCCFLTRNLLPSPSLRTACAWS